MLKEKKYEREAWKASQDRYQNGKKPNFTSGKLVEACGLHRGQVSNRTVRCVLNKYGFGYRQVRQKGVLSSNDIVYRDRFANKIRKERPRDVWPSKVTFYLDGVSLRYKRNPAGISAARANMEDKNGGSG